MSTRCASGANAISPAGWKGWRTFTEVHAAQVKAQACTPPERDLPLARWSSSELAAEARSQHIVDSVSPATIRRWLADDVIKP